MAVLRTSDFSQKEKDLLKEMRPDEKKIIAYEKTERNKPEEKPVNITWEVDNDIDER